MEKKIIETASCERQIEISVSNEELQPHFNKAYSEAQATINLKGFRKGKVPIRVIKQQYGKQIEAEALQDISQEIFNDIIHDEDFHVIGQPKLTNIENLDDGIKFTISYEVIPEFEVSNYKDLVIDEPVHVVTDKEVDSEIEAICTNSGQLVDSDNIESELYVAVLKFHELDEQTGVPIIGKEPVESKVFLADKNVMPEIKTQLIGKKIGESFEFTPASVDKFAPNTSFRIELAAAQKVIPSELTNEFIEKYTQGKFNSVEEFRDEIGYKIQEKWDQKARTEMENQIIEQLVEAHEFDVPDSIVWNVVDAMAEDIKKQYANTPQAAELTVEKMAPGLRPLAERTVKWEIIRSKIIKLEGLEVEDHDIEHLLEFEANRLKTDKETIRQAILQNKNITGNIIAKKVMDFILDFTEVNEMEFEDFNKIHKKKKDQNNDPTDEANEENSSDIIVP